MGLRTLIASSVVVAVALTACDTTAPVGDSPDVGTVSGLDSGGAGPDASVTAGLDGATLAGLDAAVAAGLDASVAAGLDAAVAAGPDASVTDHTESRGGVMHKPGATDPLQNCVACHGAALKGGSGPSCYGCHDSNDHALNRSGTMHRSGTSASCNPCHGPSNTGGLGPACKKCH